MTYVQCVADDPWASVLVAFPNSTANSTRLWASGGVGSLLQVDVRPYLTITLFGTSSSPITSTSVTLTAINDYGNSSVILSIQPNSGGSTSSSSTWWIALVVIASVLVAGAAGFFGYRYWKKRQGEERPIRDSVVSVSSAQVAQDLEGGTPKDIPEESKTGEGRQTIL